MVRKEEIHIEHNMAETETGSLSQQGSVNKHLIQIRTQNTFKMPGIFTSVWRLF